MQPTSIGNVRRPKSFFVRQIRKSAIADQMCAGETVAIVRSRARTAQFTAQAVTPFISTVEAADRAGLCLVFTAPNAFQANELVGQA